MLFLLCLHPSCTVNLVYHPDLQWPLRTRLAEYPAWVLKEKLNDCEFVSLINQFDLVCLYECWINKDDEFELENYEKFVFPRSSSKGGGIVIFYKTIFHGRLHFIENRSDSIIWIKFDKSCQSENDIYFAFCYIPPEGSVFYEKKTMLIFSIV